MATHVGTAPDVATLTRAATTTVTNPTSRALHDGRIQPSVDRGFPDLTLPIRHAAPSTSDDCSTSASPTPATPGPSSHRRLDPLTRTAQAGQDGEGKLVVQLHA